MPHTEENDSPTTSENEGFKMNWLALWVTVASLVIIGWCLGAIVSPPPSDTLQCGAEDEVQIIGNDKGVIVYCEPYSNN